jgi:hypothetical protein
MRSTVERSQDLANPPAAMLFADFQPPKNDAELGVVLVVSAIMGLISGGVPFFTGLVMRQTTLAVIGGLISGTTGFLLGCCGGFPMAIIFTVVIVVVAQNAATKAVPSPFDRPLHEDYDDYARPFQLPDRRPDPRGIPYAEEVRDESGRRHEAEDDWRRRAEERPRPPRGPRPRRPDPGGRSGR